MTENASVSKREEFLEFWERRERRFMMAVPYVLLAMCVIADLFTHRVRGASFALDAGCAAACAALMAVLDRADKRGDRSRDFWSHESALPLWFAGPALALLYLLATVLVVQNPIYGFYTWTGYLWAFRLLPGNLRFVGVIVNAVSVAISQTGSGPYRSAGAILALVAVWLINTSIASLLSWFGGIGDEQQHRRAEKVSALTEANTLLAEANARLAESLRENAELHQRLLVQARAAGVSEERQRLAREIHDTLAQGLIGIITQLQAAEAARNDPAAQRRIDAAIELARESLSEARRSVRALAPEPLAGTRLPDAVRRVAEHWSATHGIPAAFTTTGEVRVLRPQAEVALLRTVQEALANVAKHARAGRVALTLSYMDDLVTLDACDDGVGFDAAAGSLPQPTPDGGSGGFGLAAMRERIEGVAGRLAVESEPGAGTAISVAIPLEPAEDPTLGSGSAASISRIAAA